MNISRASRIVSFVLLLPLALSAQAPRDVAPLKYWPAPLYWQASHEELRAAANPELFGSIVTRAAEPAQTPANSLVFVAITPCRLVDTRTGFGFTGAFGPPSLAGSATRSFPIKASTTCTIPAIAQAYSLNVTVVPPGPLAYLTIWPMGVSQPNASTLNDTLGGIVANAAIIPAGTDGSGSVSVFVSDATNLVMDINGYYAAQSGITLTQGTAGAPSLSFASDPTTGIFSSGAGTVNIASGGTNRLTVRADGDVDLPGSIRKNGAVFLSNIGTENLALGLNTLTANTFGNFNIAIGSNGLQANTTGCCNTATGADPMDSNTTGSYNTATGNNALLTNTTGSNNSAFGHNALYTNNGNANTAAGDDALANNATGGNNVAVGYQALYGASTGNNNIAIGYQAASAISASTSNNIHIGTIGSFNDSATIKIGAAGTHTSFFAAGVRGVTTGANNAVPVLVDSNGQLGTVSSSIRFKEDVHDMADASSGLLRLRPVTYRYIQPYADGSKPLDYGLIAEEVAEVYPDLVVKNADGQVETIQYQKLTPMLLNELQKQHRETDQKTAALEEQIRLLRAELDAVKALLPRSSEK